MPNKRKILFLSPLPPPTYGSALSSQFCLQVLQANESLDVKNIKLNYSENFDDVGKMSLNKVIGYFFVLFTLLKDIVVFRPNMVYIMPATAGFAFIRDFSFSVLLLLFGKKLLVHLRTQVDEKERNNKISNFVINFVLTRSHVVVLGKELATDLLEFYQPKEISTLANALPKSLSDQEFEDIVESRKKVDAIRLVYLSNMMKEKGWPSVLKAASILKKQNVNFTLKFAGSWPSEEDQNEYKMLVTEYNLSDCVEFVGFVDATAKKELLANSDVLVFPTRYKYEAMPRVVIESMEFGMPQISTTNGAIPSLIDHGTTGFMISDNEAEEICEYVSLLTNRDTLLEIGANARKNFLSNYELEVFKRNFYNIIDRI